VSQLPAMLALASLALCALGSSPSVGEGAFVRLGDAGRLVYSEFRGGDRVPDFSPVGYGGGGTPIPMVDEVVRIAPSASGGDDTARIQGAINQLRSLEVGPDGFRGALVFEDGIYRIEGTLSVRVDGVVLRGAGSGPDGTVLVATGNRRRALIEASGQFSPQAKWATLQPIIGDVFVGADTVTVADASIFSVGDAVLVHRPASAQWITDIGMDAIPQREDGESIEQWNPDTYTFNFERVVVAIEGDSLTLDAPLPQRLEQRYGGGYVVKYSWPSRLRNIGIEGFRLVSDYEPGAEERDEQHALDGIVIDKAENGWVRDVIGRHFVESCVELGREARFFTVEDCLNLDPVSRITGSRRYSFHVIGQRNLVQRCATRGGRHDFVTGSRVEGPNAFVDCVALGTHEDIGPHHRWAMGILWDNIDGGVIRVRNRANRGTGHGWAGAQNVLWNCEGSNFVVQSPTGGWNLAIGCIGDRSRNEFDGEDGIYDHHGEHLHPRSLFIQQASERFGEDAVRSLFSDSQRVGNIADELRQRVGTEREGRDASL
jgi:hypothetical protein